MKRSFRERDPLRMGMLGMATVALLVLVSFNFTRFEGGTKYSAAFTEASGLKPNEDVRIAGVKVGKVTKVGLEGDHVKVVFQTNGGVHFGGDSRAQIKLGTILGAHYLEIQPKGGRQQSSRQEIPTSRTTPAYDVVPALQDVTSAVQQINVPQLSKALNTLNATLKGTPENVRGALAGLQKVSRAIASRDDSLSDLLKHSSNLSKVLADRSGDLAALVSDGSQLLQEINDRRTVIRSLLSGTVNLSEQITGTIDENRATLNPALKQLHNVVNILQRNQDNLDHAINVLGPFVTVSLDATGSGRWFDGYLQNLIPFPTSIKPSAGTPSSKATPGGDTLPIIH